MDFRICLIFVVVCVFRGATITTTPITPPPIPTPPISTTTTATTTPTQTVSTTTVRRTRTRPETATTTTTPTSVITTPQTFTTVSSELFYTPDYDNLFVGFDDVIVTCVVIISSKQNLTVTLMDVNTGDILQKQFGIYEPLIMFHNLELQTGTMNHKCTVATDGGVVSQDTVSVRVQDMYTQKITNLQTEIKSGGVNVIWETTHPRLANESFLLSVHDVSDEVRQAFTTQEAEYSLTDLSHSHTYLLRVQVVNRLNNTNNYTQISYTHTEVTINTQINIIVYVAVGLLVFVVILVSTIVVCSATLVRIVLKNKKTNKYKYSKSLEETAPPTNTPSNKEYISLSDVNIITKIRQTHNYEPMTSVYPQKECSPLEVSDTHNYCEISELHFESDKDIRDTKYEKLDNVVSS